MNRAPFVSSLVSSLLSLALALAGCCCDDDDDCDDCDGPPVFFEVEPNDDEQTANYFGVIQPGDFFYIDGFIQQGGPVDGFAFTASQPLHVDFQLFIQDAGDDLDVCLYDPLIDQTVACFETDINPERGGVDVTGANLDFHLVVSSFLGTSMYSLEIAVQPLFVAAEPGPAAAPGAEPDFLAGPGLLPPGLLPIGASDAPTRNASALADYSPEPPSGPRLRVERELRFDPDTGLWIERVRVLSLGAR